MLATLKFPSLLEDLLEGFLAVGKGDPGVGVAVWTPEADGEVPRHVSFPRILMIPVCREPAGGFPRKVNGGAA